MKTPYVLLLSFPGINVVSAAEFAGEMGPIANSPGDAAITGRAGLYPSRYQSDATDHTGPLVRRGNRPLRYVILLIAENLLRCNDHFRGLGEAWRAAGANRRVAVVRAAKRFCRIAYRMVAGGQVYRHPGCRERHYILAKLSMFYIEHETPLEQVSRDLRAAVDWIPRAEYAAEARPLEAGSPTAAPAGRPRRPRPSRRATVELERTSKRAASVERDPARGLTPTGGDDGRIESVRGDRPHLTATARGPNNASCPRGALTP